MAINHFILRGNVHDRAGNDVDPRRTHVWLVACDANGPIQRIVDPDSDEERYGNTKATVNADGSYAFSNLWPTDAATNPTGYYYELFIEYPLARGGKGRAGNGNKELWRSGPFQIASAASPGLAIDAADIDFDTPAVSATWRSAFMDQAEALLAAQVDISGISTSDDVVETLLKGTGGAGPKTRAQLGDTYATLAGRTKNAPAFNIYFAEAFGAVQDGVTDNSPAIQAAVDSLPRGAKLYFKGTSTNAIYYRMLSTVVITNPYITLHGDMVSHTTSSIRGATPGMTMFQVDAPGVYFTNLAILGDGTPAMRDGTVTGIKFRGSVWGDVDTAVTDCTFVWLHTGIVCHGRNLVVRGTLFGEIIRGVDYRGVDTTYHDMGTGSSPVNRGNIVRECRFHGVGNSDADFCIKFSGQNMDSRWAAVEDNDFDMFNNGVGVLVVGTTTSKIRHLTCQGNRHHDTGQTAYHFTHADEFVISDARISGIAASGYPFNGIRLFSCTGGKVSSVYINRTGASAVYARYCSNIDFEQVKIQLAGIDTSVVGHGFDIDDSNSSIRGKGISVDNVDGWGWTGSPTMSSLQDARFVNCATGRVFSTTVAEESVWVAGTSMSTVAGSPAPVTQNSYRVMALDPATIEQVAAFVDVPSNWSTFALEAWFTATDPTAGDVRVQGGATPVIDNADLTSGSVAAQTLTLNTGTAKVTKVTLVNATARPTSGSVGVRVARLGSDALDTYAGDLGLIGVRLVRTA